MISVELHGIAGVRHIFGAPNPAAPPEYADAAVPWVVVELFDDAGGQVNLMLDSPEAAEVVRHAGKLARDYLRAGPGR
jgi:hypothetical protein